MGFEMKRVVVALGGNAILTDNPTDQAQKQVVQKTVMQLTSLVKEGYQLVITHGNGPQVGNLLLQQSASNSKKNPAMGLDTCVAMTEGSIGYWLQQGLINEFAKEKIEKEVVCLLTQVIVSKDDPAFTNPTKPIGPFLSEQKAKINQEQTGETYREDAGRGWRKVVPSPKPLLIKEYSVVKKLMLQDVVTISTGGGGIPVIERDGILIGTEAVVDKDFASQKLASLIYLSF